MRTPLRRLPPAVLLVLALVGALGCGGGGNDKHAEALLDKAFKHSIKSADLKLDAEIQAKRQSAPDQSFRVKASGPFRTNKGKLPSADLDVSLTTGAGQPVQTGFLSTGDRAFLKFQDVYYEQPSSVVEKANRSIASHGGRRGSLKALGLDPHRWLEDAHTEGDEQVAGADTTHVSGKLGVRQVVQDFNNFVRRSGGTIGSATGQVPRPLTKSQIDKVSQVVKDPSFDVYVAKDDGTIRRLSAHVDFKAPEGGSAGRGGIEGGSLSFTIEFSNLDGNQKIVAPARARPLSDLTKALGTGVLGGSSASGTSTAPAPSTSAPGAQAFKRYANCLDKANPQDTDALQRCAELLH